MTKGEQTRERIFQAALQDFAEHGYDGAKVARIAELAHVNKERLYANFGSKEQMFIEVWRRTYQLIIDEDQNFFHAITQDNIADMGKIILRRYMEFHDRHPEFWKIFAWENLLGGRHNDVVKDLKRPIHEYLEGLYHLGQERGVFKQSVSFQTFMLVLISISFTYASNKATMSQTLGLELTRANVEEHYIEECYEMLFS